VVDGIVGPLVRGRVAFDVLQAALPTESVAPARQDTAALACLWTAEAGSIQIQPHPLDAPEEGSPFAALMVMLGSAQAIFFALFTGVFGINAIYEDRIQGTLQRLIVTPTPRSAILAGRLLGNLGVVMAQLLILLLAFTTMTTLVEREWTFIWGNHPLALLAVVLGLSLFTTGLGVLIVGLARSSEQVQVVGPLITIGLSALSGSFGFALPATAARFSPIWWGVDALRKLASGEPDVGLHLLVLFAVGGLFAAIGTYFFRRRMEL
jgi:ABC-type Na+ efflux pump permease subunit